MEISLQKHSTKPSVLKCVRKDGTITWAKLHPGTETHDLAHFAMETVLKFKDAFYGLLQQGYEISDFELPKGERPAALEPSQLSPSALQTEHLVNLLQIYLFNSEGTIPLLDQFKTILQENNIPYPTQLDSERLAEIQEKFKQLVNQWRSLPEAAWLHLQFDLD